MGKNQKVNTTSKPILYHYWRSSCSWRVRWALIHKGVAYDEVAVNLLNGEQNSADFLAQNPQGYLPALKIGSTVYSESLAMLEWIEERYPARPLLPMSPEDRMRVRQISSFIISGIQPLQNLSVLKKISSDPNEQSTWARHWISSGLTKLEKILQSSAGTYCVGSQLTFADLCLIPQIYNANRFAVDLSELPIISRINAACLLRDDCQKASPMNQPGAS
jgi:maleylacetoacetate isomerase